MNLDDMMEVWRSQDASPLHGANEALVRLELRQDEAKQQKLRRGTRLFVILLTAFSVAGRLQELSTIISLYRADVLTVWDCAIPIAGAAAALLWARTMFARQRAQAARDQRFGDSLRDQIRRQLGRLDDTAMRSCANLIGILLLPIVWSFTIILASWRIHGRSYSDPWLSVPIIFMICWCIACVGGTIWWTRRVVQRKVLPRKRRLEALLAELDA